MDLTPECATVTVRGPISGCEVFWCPSSGADRDGAGAPWPRSLERWAEQ